MNKKSKVTLIVAVALFLIAGLFVLRSYYAEKLGIFADILTEDKVISSRTVSNDDFASDKITNLEKGEDSYVVKGEPLAKCGGVDEITAGELPKAATMTIETAKVEGDEKHQVNSFDQKYYIGNELVEGETSKTVPIVPAGDDFATQPGEMSISRGLGKIQFKLSKNLQGGYNAFAGSITFSDRVTLNANSLNFSVGGGIVENPSDGTTDLTSKNDEVTLSAEGNKIDFYLVTSGGNDTFEINYCIKSHISTEGKIVGQIDLGTAKPLNRLVANIKNYNKGRDEVVLSAKVSNDGNRWVSIEEATNTPLSFQGDTPLDTFCFKYVKYTIVLKTKTTNPPLEFMGFDLYGADNCGMRTGFDPGDGSYNTQCSNGKDDDGDGKIDFPDDPGCTSKMDDSERDPVKVCRSEDSRNITLKVDIAKHQDVDGNDLSRLIYIGEDKRGRASGTKIPLVSGGEAVKDGGILDVVDGLSVYRGEGYFYLHNESGANVRESMEINFLLNGATITKVQNATLEEPTNGIAAFGNPLDDEYQIQVGSNRGKVVTTSGDKSDGLYVYYDYITSIGGGCQCQDGIDNDGNGKIDFPDDLGCDSALDNKEEASVAQKTDYPVCGNGLDDDGDGKIDFPADTACESVLDGSENDARRVCTANDKINVNLTVSDIEVKNSEGGNVGNEIYVGGAGQYGEGKPIALVSKGIAIVDDTIQESVPGVSIKRGPGYVYILLKNDEASIGNEFFKGKFSVTGGKITKAVNGLTRLGGTASFFLGGPFESQGDGQFDETGQNPQQDEFTLVDSSYVEIASITRGESDSVYIYYDYDDVVLGGCQCQDGIDNDKDGLIDYPNDKGCESPEDDSEVDSIADIVKDPTKILPAVISSGVGFWTLIGIIILISGGLIIRTLTSQPTKKVE